jgi:hypothetical protein
MGMAPTGLDYVMLTLDDPKKDGRMTRFAQWLAAEAQMTVHASKSVISCDLQGIDGDHGGG